MYTPLKAYADNLKSLQKNWFDVDKYYKEKNWLNNTELTNLRPSLATLKNKKDLVGIEIGVGNCLNSKNILNNLDIKQLYLVDHIKHSSPHSEEVFNNEKVTFLKGDSVSVINNITEQFDFVYLDASHAYEYVIQEIQLMLPKLKVGGLLAGHDYEQIGVVTGVNTFMFNLWRDTKEKPLINYESCTDNHPGYPQEYKEYGFPIDWWYVKTDSVPSNFTIYPLRNG